MKAGNWTIKWQYRYRRPKDKWTGDVNIERDTECLILQDDKIINRGSAFCSINDHFRRDTGRKISLARALKNAGVPKEARKVIWELYRKTKPGGRW